MKRKIQLVTENQRVLVFKNQVLNDVLTAGKHKFWDMDEDLEFVTFDIDNLYFSERNAERLYKNSNILRDHMSHWKIESHEIGLLYVNDQLKGIVAPSENLYVWKDAGDLRLDRVSIEATNSHYENLQVDEKLIMLINRSGANTASRLIRSDATVAIKPIANLTVAKDHIGLLYIDDKLIKHLEPGQHNFWQFHHNIELKSYDCRTQMLEISGQEILSKDRVSLRINLSASIKIIDAELAACSVDNLNDYIYKTLQLALREAVGTKSLDDILLDKLYVNETVKELVTKLLISVGVSLVNVGVKDIILPGEIKTILNQVVEAQKAAEANSIKRREETSATRSLHNTAKMMENNPTLLRLKELEALEKVADKINNLNVYGGLDGLMNGTIKMN